MKIQQVSLFFLLMAVYLLVFAGLAFLADSSICVFAAESRTEQRKIATSSVAKEKEEAIESAGISVSQSRKRSIPRFGLSLENEEIICGQNVHVAVRGLRETDEITFIIKENGSSIEDEGEELEFDRFSSVLYTDKLETGSWQLMVAITRENNSASFTCDLIILDKPDEISAVHSFAEKDLPEKKHKHTVSSSAALTSAGSYVNEGVWIKDGNNWKLMTKSGAFAANQWAFIDGHWYVFDSDGKMMTGWQNIDQKWYFMHEDGAMATGWILIHDKWYCLGPTGAMYASATTPDGYQVNADGEWIP